METVFDMNHLRRINIFYISIFLSAVLCKCVTLAALTDECGVINTDQLRNKQKYTEIDEFPWMAELAYKHTETLTTSFLCQAVLIDQRHLVTVAHCLAAISDTLEPYAVLFGDWNSKNNHTEADCDNVRFKCSYPILIDIEEIILYPISDKKKKNNDIAILRLTQKVTYSDYIRPICLPSNDIKTKEFGSEQLILTGWLLREPGIKQKMSLFILNQHDCRRKYDKITKQEISDSQLCGIACEDDKSHMSSAALMDIKDHKSQSPEKVYLVGLLSFGASCAQQIPDVFTRVDQYVDWIKENIS